MKATPPVLLALVLWALAGCAAPKIERNRLDRPATCAELHPHFTTPDGHHIAFRHWTPSGRPRAVIAGITGWQSSACDWEAVGEGLAHRGYELYVSGRRGQWGDVEQTTRDPRGLGDIRTWKQWVEDYAAFTRWVAARHPDVPLVYGAISLGTTETLIVAAEPRWGGVSPRGIFIISPSLVFLYPKKDLARKDLLGRIFQDQNARFADLKSVATSRTGIFNDSKQWEEWSHSKDRVESFTYRWAANMFDAGKAARRAAPKVQRPVLLMVGDNDPLLGRAIPDAEGRLVAALQNEPTKHYPSGNHALWSSEPPRRQMLADLVAWLERVSGR